MRIATCKVLGSTVLLWGCAPVARQGADVTVENRSQFLMENVVAHGTGFDIPIGNIQPGAVHKLRVQPTGESSLRLTFAAGGRPIETRSDGYFEGGGYCVNATVTTAFDLEVTSKLSPC
jgi:hypothetical protein